MALRLSARPWRTSSPRYGRSCAYDELVGELKLRACEHRAEKPRGSIITGRFINSYGIIAVKVVKLLLSQHSE
jgi:hypothetical protein